MNRSSRTAYQDMANHPPSGDFVKAEVFPRGTYLFDILNLLKILLDPGQFPEYSMLLGIGAIESQICYGNQFSSYSTEQEHQQNKMDSIA